MFMTRMRKKTWQQKVDLVKGSFNRASSNITFAEKFYQNLFFLNPVIKKYFEKTDFEHQEKALMHGLTFLIEFLDQKDELARTRVLRIARTHSVHGMKIHPHHYYYWIEAVILTARSLDADWYDDLEYYWREVINFPISFIISQYFNSAQT